MKNHLTGFVISALIHSGLVSGAIYLNKKEIKVKTPEEKVTLMVSLFQEEVKPLVKTPIQEDLSTVPKVAEPEKVAEPKKITPPEPVIEKIIPAIKVASINPKLVPQIEKAKLVEESVSKPEVIKAEPPKPKLNKPKPVKKLKKKTKKKLVKKTIKRKVLKKKVVRKKSVKRKAIVKKKAKPVKRRVVVRKRLIQKPRKVVAKRIVKRVKAQPRHAISTPIKRVVRRPVAKHVKPNRNTAQFHKQGAGVYKKKPVVSTAANTNLSRQYKSRLQGIISAYSKKHYPKRAKRRGQQGKVTVAFTVIHSGMIKNIRIIRSSNSRSLDAAAIVAIKKASKKLPYFKGMSKNTLNLTITLAYVLR